MTSPLGAYLVETAIALAAVVALAVLVLYGARRLGVGRPTGNIELLGRLPLEARRSIYLVRVVDRVLIIGASEAGLHRLGQLPHGAALAGDAARAVPRFSEVLQAALGRSAARPSESTAAAAASEPPPASGAAQASGAVPAESATDVRRTRTGGAG